MLRENQAERLASETDEERQRRLQVLRDNRTQRISSETEGERASRLGNLHSIANNSRRLAFEDNEEAERRRHDESDRQRRHRELERLRPQRIVLTQSYAKMAMFHSDLAALELSKCSICLERSHVKKSQDSERLICARCKREKANPKVYSSEANMDPGPAPQELFGLTQVEEMLVAAVMPMMSIYRLPYGQYGYSGHVINFPQDVLRFAASLPRLPSQLDVMVVRREGTAPGQSHRDFHVRRSVVERALRYLVTNNKYYKTNEVRIDDEKLAQLPENGSLSDILSVTVVSDTADRQEHTLNAQNSQPADQVSNDFEQGDKIVRSFVPGVTQPLTEQETVRQFVHGQPSDNQQRSQQTLMWPSIGGRPINEFNTEGYFS